MGKLLPAMELVSVIVRTKDRPTLLREALESLANQTYPYLEVVVVNDGGEDVYKIVSEFEEKFSHLKYIVHETNRGRAVAANTGLAAAEGEWIGFLDDDDLLLPRAIETLLNAADDQYILIYGKSRLVKNSTHQTEFISVYGRPFDRKLLYFQN